mmetsp:Transcript_58948/g.140452  ORF Transcript_58948/g.140452 Transcript_58948/m.140452 type:complete len:248 (+) Transcript_58948:499-1242(+)
MCVPCLGLVCFPHDGDLLQDRPFFGRLRSRRVRGLGDDEGPLHGVLLCAGLLHLRPAYRQEPGALWGQVMVRGRFGRQCCADLWSGFGSQLAHALGVPGSYSLRTPECHVYITLWCSGTHYARHRHSDRHRIHPWAHCDGLPQERLPSIAHECSGEGRDRRGRAEAFGAPPDVGQLRDGQHRRRLCRAPLRCLRPLLPRLDDAHGRPGLHVLTASACRCVHSNRAGRPPRKADGCALGLPARRHKVV